MNWCEPTWVRSVRAEAISLPYITDTVLLTGWSVYITPKSQMKDDGSVIRCIAVCRWELELLSVWYLTTSSTCFCPFLPARLLCFLLPVCLPRCLCTAWGHPYYFYWTEPGALHIPAHWMPVTLIQVFWKDPSTPLHCAHTVTFNKMIFTCVYLQRKSTATTKKKSFLLRQ